MRGHFILTPANQLLVTGQRIRSLEIETKMLDEEDKE
jgi:hypothetical protein